ncbi:lactosylceramide 4-alpha-galactosyltransferase-like [Trichoplusia ni]|uniref:Lactosylceramide 4-alpha-galactosyltransferase-like n=1 Tax=Trichoplusia ni TaxID=7111 RepID=A0A7E5VGV6_TRINI|nr:lactosylceramide 4-alpha-galactosyltransferase-like [Trichoplusia ni]
MQAVFNHLFIQYNGVYRVITVSTFVALYLLYDMLGHSGPSYAIPRKQSINTSCHYTNFEDALEAADAKFSLPLWSIFFIESSCHGGLNSRQACSIESAARAHPLWQITVFFLSPVSEHTLNHSCLRTLKQFRNVKFVRIKIKEFTEDTPLESMISEKHLQNSSFPVENYSNALRYLILYKWGGIYLDTDMLVIKSLSPLGANWVGTEDRRHINAAALGISSDTIGTQFAADLLGEFTREYKARVSGANGPKLITRVLEKNWCYPYQFKEWSTMTCRGISVYSPRLFYPVHYRKGRELFESSNLDILNNVTYAVHTWNRLTKNYTISNNSPYERLAKRYCPSIYNFYGNKFGE